MRDVSAAAPFLRWHNIRAEPKQVMQMPQTVLSRSAESRAVTGPVRPPVNWSRTVTVLFFLAPAVILYLLFVLFPVVQAAHYSLYKWNGLGPLTNMIGLENYARIFADPIFHRAISNNLIIAGLSLLIQLPFALGLALMTGRSMPGKTFFRTVYFLPYVLADVATAVMWRSIYNPQSGLINGLAKHFGWEPQAWLSDPQTVLYAIFVVITWKYFGFHLVLFMSGLQQIPAELEEAALIDGCNRRQVLRYVTLPLLGSTIRLCIYLSVLGSIQFFDLIWVISGGGPTNASETMVTYLYKFGFQRFALGYGSAVAVVLFGLSLVFSLLYQRYVMGRDMAASRVTAR
ncbi:MAG: carbohydrate ABC transporter permease [Bacillota bacterium]